MSHTLSWSHGDHRRSNNSPREAKKTELVVGTNYEYRLIFRSGGRPNPRDLSFKGVSENRIFEYRA